MFKMLTLHFRPIVLILLYIVGTTNCSRQISFEKNPNCTQDCEKPWIIHGKGVSANDTVHYLWSAVQLPSFVLAITNHEAEIKINWKSLQAGQPGGISFTESPKNLFSTSFQNLILFNDENDSGKLDDIPDKDKKNASLSEFEWAVDTFDMNPSSESVIKFYTTSFRNTPLVNETKITISATAYGTEGRSNSLPHLITTPESVHLEVALNNLILDLDPPLKHPKSDVLPIGNFSHPRWALDMIIVATDNSSGDGTAFHYDKTKSLDDEHSPGVFDVNSITTKGAREPLSTSSPNSGGYLQWRPVAYLTPDKDINFSTFPNLNASLPPVDDEHFNQTKLSLIYVLFGEQAKTLPNAQTPVAFGLPGDGFYTKYSYTVWTFSMGLGAVREESFSALIIILISVGVGLPCVLFLAGGTFLAVKRMRRRGELLINE